MDNITLPQDYYCNWCGQKLTSKDAHCTTPGCPGSILSSSTVTAKETNGYDDRAMDTEI